MLGFVVVVFVFLYATFACYVCLIESGSVWTGEMSGSQLQHRSAGSPLLGLPGPSASALSTIPGWPERLPLLADERGKLRMP